MPGAFASSSSLACETALTVLKCFSSARHLFSPTPSIARPQDTVDFIKNENTRLSIHGRHDPAIIRRICPVLDSVAALCIADMLSARYGTDVLTKGADKR